MKLKEEIAAQKGFQLVLDSQAGQPLRQANFSGRPTTDASTRELEYIQPKGASLP
jgi:hypothetical protein